MKIELGGGCSAGYWYLLLFFLSASCSFGKPDFVQNQAVIGDTDVDLLNKIL